MKRRRFEYFHVELSVALERLVPRYELWLCMSDRGHDPERLGRAALLRFFDEDLDDFLAQRRWSLPEGGRRRLRRSLERFDPRHPTPYEFMERISLA